MVNVVVATSFMSPAFALAVLAGAVAPDVPIVVQHTRLDSRQAENALLSTIAFADND